MLLEVLKRPTYDDWAVYQGEVVRELGSSKRAAARKAKQLAGPGDTVQIYDENDNLDEEMLFDENGNAVKA